MKIIKDSISIKELKVIAENSFGNMVKGVVDIKQRIMAIEAELHSDQEAYLIANEDSKQEDLWGINLYPDMPEEEWIEYDSVINLRPLNGNQSRGVDNPQLREEISAIVNGLVER